ncbi:hypothetical protein Godav_025019 [Gossypium davidsonii]|uniref:Uncharacterized protein n=1 Tax=Gossypium davidsonii TaxID=34287 RepID=A0A7J8TD32_GOSDV|nr:hypothetical protein [Gossypium davidsonii]
MYNFLIEHHNNDDILRCHQLVYYQNEWLLALEYFVKVVTYFNKKEM